MPDHVDQLLLQLEDEVVDELPMLEKSVPMEFHHVQTIIHEKHVSMLVYHLISVILLILLDKISVQIKHFLVLDEGVVDEGVVVAEHVEMEYLSHYLEKNVM